MGFAVMYGLRHVIQSLLIHHLATFSNMALVS